MMRERYESIPLVDLKEMAKNRGIKGISSMKKADLVEAMLKKDEENTSDISNADNNEINSDAAKKASSKTTKKENSKISEKENSKTITKQKINADSESNVLSEVSNEKGKNGLSDNLKEFKDKDYKSIKKKNTFNKENSSENIVTLINENNNNDIKKSEIKHDNTKTFVKKEYSKDYGKDFSKDTSKEYSKDYIKENSGKENSGKENSGKENFGKENSGKDISKDVSKEYTKDTQKNTGKELSKTTIYTNEEEVPSELDSGIIAKGILEVMSDGFGFIRSDNFLPGDSDVYVAPGQIRKFGLRTGDILEGHLKNKSATEKFAALLYLTSINGMDPEVSKKRYAFENMTPIFPNEKIKLSIPGAPLSMRIMDLLSPVGKGQRGMIVSPPKAGKTTLLKSVAKSVKASNPDMHMIILLIDERPEEVTDIKEEVMGANVEVIYSTFDETPEHHKRVAEMVIERARRLVEYKKDVIILLDSITRLTRAYNQVVPPSGRTLSGGLDPAALHMPKRFFGAARNMREGGSLTILATALVETGSKMDDVVYEEFKGTGNMEMVLDRKLSERRVFPAIDIAKSGTRRDDLLLTKEELYVINNLRRQFNEMQNNDAVDKALDMFSKTRTNEEFVLQVQKRFNFNN